MRVFRSRGYVVFIWFLNSYLCLKSATMATPENAKTIPCKSGGISKSLLTPCRRVGLSRKIATPNRHPSLINTTHTVATPAAAKNTPCRSDGISKSLLTPCRRIGLSRKFITPNRHAGLINTTPVAVKETLPVAVKGTLPAAVTETPPAAVTETPPIEKKNMKSTRKRHVNSRTNSNCKVSTEKVLVSKENIACNNVQASVLDRSYTITDSPLRNTIENKLKSPKLTDNIPVIHCSSPETNSPHSENLNETTKSPTLKDQKINNKTKMHKPKIKLFKRLSMKRNSSLTQDDLSDLEDLPSTRPTSMSSLLSEEFKECLVTNETDNDSSESVSVALSKRNKKRRVIYSSDEEDFVPSQKQVKIERVSSTNLEDLDAKITELKRQIEKKTTHLADLKQAAVYRRLHNTDELKCLTTMWKSGCQDGLRHLLRKMQEHVHMDMCTLLRNLKIPPTIISYNVDNDCFV